jgi:hypothetical protein
MKGPQTIMTNPETKKKIPFTFDYSFWSFNSDDEHFADNSTIWKAFGQDMMDNIWEGYNVSLFAYGQSGSGKSYSMFGSKGKDEGLIIKACENLFRNIKNNENDNISFDFKISQLEIYNEEVRDLFNPKNRPSGGLKIRQHPSKF